MRLAALLAIIAVLGWPGAVASQTPGEAVDRFAGTSVPAPAFLGLAAPPQVADSLLPPDYALMTLAGITTAGASLLLTWLLMDRPVGIRYYDFAFYGPIPGTVLVPLVIHSVNGGRGNVLASLGASAAIWAVFAVVPNPLLTPAVQIPVAMLIETATMDGVP